MSCPFCDRIEAGDLAAESEAAVAFPDAFPLTEGHTLVVPRRHERDFFTLSPAEQAAVWQLVARMRDELNARLAPAGFNVGVNAGKAAGQTIDHAHVHLIPRFTGDTEDPRGGVRHVMPAKAHYWER